MNLTKKDLTQIALALVARTFMIKQRIACAQAYPPLTSEKEIWEAELKLVKNVSDKIYNEEARLENEKDPFEGIDDVV